MNKIVKYFHETHEEILKVTWPTKKETYNYTLLIIGISLAVAFFLGGLDYIFNLSLEKILSLK